MTKDLQEDVRKSVDIDVQNGDASRQRLLEDSTLATGSNSTNERMISPNTSKEVLPGMEITGKNVPKHKPLNWCGTVEKGEIVHVPGKNKPVDPYVGAGS